MNFEVIEDAIIQLLDIPGTIVSPLPDDVTALNAPRQTAKPQLYVIVGSGALGDREELGVVNQLEAIRWQVFIRARDRRGELGVFDLYEKITHCLLGQRIPGAKHAITFSNFDYVNGTHNNWQYALTGSLSAYRTESEDSSYYPIMRKITHEFKEQ